MPHVDTKDLKEKIDVKELLEDYSLDKITDDGDWVKSVCPYHEDSNPSFCMRKSDTYFHCWSCEATGDAIQFISDQDNITFKEALDKLMAISGYVVTKGSQLEYLKKVWLNKKAPEKEPEPGLLEDKRIFELNKLANDLFVSDLQRGIGKNYVLGRGYSLQLCQRINIGFCSKGFTHKATSDWGFSHDELYTAGFLKGDGSERFAERITFPIKNEHRDIVGFTARALDDSEPKYSNTPTSSFYKKSYFLLGIENIRKGEPITLVEGNFDLARLTSKGVNVLASLGGAFSNTQAQIVRRYTNSVTILYDGDEAGKKATIKTFLALLEHGLKIYVINLPDGEDPDSHVEDNKPVTAIDGMVHYVNYQVGQGVGTAKVLSLLLSKVAKIKKMEERAWYIEKLSEVFDLSLETIESELKKS